MVDRAKPTDVIRTYLTHLANDEFEEAVEQFADEVEYIHPPNFQGVSKVEGKDALYRYFTETRGPQDHDYEITKEVNDGSEGILTGTITGGVEANNEFVSYGKLDGGTLTTYVVGLNKRTDPEN